MKAGQSQKKLYNNNRVHKIYKTPSPLQYIVYISTIQQVILKWFHKNYKTTSSLQYLQSKKWYSNGSTKFTKQHPHYNIFNPTRDTQMGPKNLQNNIPFTISTIQKVILKWFHKNYNTTSPLKYPQSKRWYNTHFKFIIWNYKLSIRSSI